MGYRSVKMVPMIFGLGVNEGFVSASYHCIVSLFMSFSMGGETDFAK